LANYFTENKFKTSNGHKFIANNKLWGEMVITPQLNKVDWLNWAFGIEIINNHWEVTAESAKSQKFIL